MIFLSVFFTRFGFTLSQSVIINYASIAIGALVSIAVSLFGFGIGNSKIFAFSTAVFPVAFSFFLYSINFFYPWFAFATFIFVSGISSLSKNLILDLKKKNKNPSTFYYLLMNSLSFCSIIGISYLYNLFNYFYVLTFGLMFSSIMFFRIMLIFDDKSQEEADEDSEPLEKFDTNQIFKVILLLSPFFAVSTYCWTYWFFQASMLNNDFFGFKIPFQQTAAFIPLFSAMFIPIISKVIKKYKIDVINQISLGAFFIVASVMCSYEIQDLLVLKKWNISILSQIIPAVFLAIGNSLIFASLLSFFQLLTLGSIIPFCITQIVVILGCMFNIFIALLAKDNILLTLGISSMVCILCLPFLLVSLKKLRESVLYERITD